MKWETFAEGCAVLTIAVCISLLFIRAVENITDSHTEHACSNLYAESITRDGKDFLVRMTEAELRLVHPMLNQYLDLTPREPHQCVTDPGESGMANPEHPTTVYIKGGMTAQQYPGPRVNKK